METSKPITTRRVIKPSSGQEPVRTAPPRPQPSADPALVPVGRPEHALWRAWEQRFAETDRALVAADARERNGWEQAPRIANPGETERIQLRFLAPWTALIETFAAAAIASPLGEAQRQAVHGYLELRAAWYRALMRRFLVPSDNAVRAVAELGARLDAAVAARRR